MTCICFPFFFLLFSKYQDLTFVYYFFKDTFCYLFCHLICFQNWRKFKISLKETGYKLELWRSWFKRIEGNVTTIQLVFRPLSINATRVTVEQELLILSEHLSCIMILCLCSCCSVFSSLYIVLVVAWQSLDWGFL